MSSSGCRDFLDRSFALFLAFGCSGKLVPCATTASIEEWLTHILIISLFFLKERLTMLRVKIKFCRFRLFTSVASIFVCPTVKCNNCWNQALASIGMVKLWKMREKKVPKGKTRSRARRMADRSLWRSTRTQDCVYCKSTETPRTRSQNNVRQTQKERKSIL